MQVAPQPADPMKVCLVLEDGFRGWIIEKFAVRLEKELRAWGVNPWIAPEPSAEADVNHWMFYGHAWQQLVNLDRELVGWHSMMITHVDDPLKTKMIQEVIGRGMHMGVCMSRMTAAELVSRGIDATRLCYVTPGHDDVAKPRRLRVAITSRVRSDGMKREWLLVRLAERVALDLFHFEIIGKGWEPLIPHLEAAGATVRHFPETGDFDADYGVLLERLRACDYYLYLGLDEGSMGLFDALAAGLETIVTEQGFHLDIEGAIDHGFTEADELVEIFEQIAARRRRKLAVVERLSWGEYARKHAVLWRACLQGGGAEVGALLGQPQAPVQMRRPSWRAALEYYGNLRTSTYRGHFLGRALARGRAALARAKRLVFPK